MTTLDVEQGPLETDTLLGGVQKAFGSTATSFLNSGLDQAAKLKDWVSSGPMTMRILAFIGGAATVFRGVCYIFSILNPFNVLLGVYICLFGVVAMALETPKSRKAQLVIEEWVKFLSRTGGRGLFYIFVGSLLFTKWKFLDILVGGYMMGVGVLCLIVAKTAAIKLNSIKLLLGGSLSVTDPAVIKEKFSDIDKDHNGHVTLDELEELCNALGGDLSRNELIAAMNFMDKDRNGTVEYDEFVQWWKSSNSYVI